jgi:hypothetical protein
MTATHPWVIPGEQTWVTSRERSSGVDEHVDLPFPFLEFRVGELTPSNAGLAFDCIILTNLEPQGWVWLGTYRLEDLDSFPTARCYEALPGQIGVLLSSEDFLRFVS